MNDTIAAISSSGGPIGLIRVSGERAIEAINAVFQAKNGKPLTEAPSQKLVYGTLTDKSGNVIDCCYAVALHAPHTYTGETMAELQCHGSTAVLCAGLDALFAQGVRQAEAGEFTRRAFLNGKMGLSEAEAVHDLITARTAEAAQNAAAQVMGAVGSPVQQMRDELLGMVAHFHAVVDFPDEDIDPVLFEDAAALLHRTTSRLYSMAESYERGRILREGVPCVILGRPNAGKSTLISAVSNAKPRIADYPFTTLHPHLGVVRAGPESSFVIADIPGLIEGASEGVGLGHEFLRHIERTKVLIHVVDAAGTEGRDPITDIYAINAELANYSEELARKPQVIAANKTDAIYDLEESPVEQLRKEFGPKGIDVFPISAVSGKGVNELLYHVRQMLDGLDEKPTVFEQEYFPEMALAVSDEPYTVTYDELEQEYVVEGPRIEKMLGYTNLESEKGFAFFQGFLKDAGILDKLEELGIQEGDTVRMYGLSFDYYK